MQKSRQEIYLIIFALILLVSPGFYASIAYGQDIEKRLSDLEETLKKQQETIKGQQNLIEGLKDELGKLKSAEAQGSTKPLPVTTTQEEGQQKQPKSLSVGGLFGASSMLNPNISVVLNTYGYASQMTDSTLKNRGIPGYYTNSQVTADMANTRGFNLDSAELYIFAPVDPYFNLYTTIPVTEDGVSIEEAYFTTTALPDGLQIKGGKFRSGFGRLNAQHSHVWSFVDAPLAYKAFTGSEGIDEKGVQVTYLPDLLIPLTIGAEALQGDNDILFGKDAESAPHAYTAFAKVSFDIGDDSTILTGLSLISGKTRSNAIADNTIFVGNSTLYGVEFTYKWKPSRLSSLTLQSEYLLRSQSGDLTNETSLKISPLKRQQDGFYIQSAYQFGLWTWGVRYDRLGIFRDDFQRQGDLSQSFGNAPWRASTEMSLDLTEFSRLRLQYNYDRSGRDDKTNNELFLQVILGIGAHGAHTF
ncbi:MAG: hypothetical protein HQL02_02540 [Nitrospirae bacterium]|nr:hypothetical protein [Nitrospirota bacterium]